MHTNNSKILFEEAKKSIPGGVNSPVRAFQSVKKDYPIFIKSANGSKLYDEDGNEYLDMIGSWGPMILGHNYPEVLEIVKEEIENGTSFGLPTKKEVILAELVKECFPSIKKLRLTTSGTEAAMAAVRVARAYTGKNKIIKFEGCYHGHSDSLLVKAGSGLLTFEHQDSNGITKSVTQDTITAPFGDIEKIKEILANEKDVACVIVEPIPANMGLIETEKEFLQQLRELTAKENVVLNYARFDDLRENNRWRISCWRFRWKRRNYEFDFTSWECLSCRNAFWKSSFCSSRNKNNFYFERKSKNL